MPSSVTERAEAVLLNISWDLRTIQSQAYKIQDDLANKTHKGFVDQQWVLYRKPAMDAWSLASNIVVAYDPGLIKQLLNTTETKDALEFVGRLNGAMTSLVVDPSNVAVQAGLQRLQTGQQELTTYLNSLLSLMQTHDAAIQRLQNMEGANRQAG